MAVSMWWPEGACPSLSQAHTGAVKELFFPVLGKSFLQILHWERSAWMFKVSLG